MYITCFDVLWPHLPKYHSDSKHYKDTTEFQAFKIQCTKSNLWEAKPFALTVYSLSLLQGEKKVPDSNVLLFDEDPFTLYCPIFTQTMYDILQYCQQDASTTTDLFVLLCYWQRRVSTFKNFIALERWQLLVLLGRAHIESASVYYTSLIVVNDALEQQVSQAITIEPKKNVSFVF